jgi:hypothetical protein
MHPMSVHVYLWWLTTTTTLHDRLADALRDERGEVTANTAMIVLLVVAAITAGGIIATKLVANANNVPSP